MILYHGTDTMFKIPKLEKCRAGKDFGRGFYLSDHIAIARDWAKKISTSNNDSFIHEFEVRLDHLNTCNLKIKVFNKADEEWIDFIYRNRYKRDKTHREPTYDIIVGPIADNKLREKFDQYHYHIISKKELAETVLFYKFPKSNQYCFSTENALKLLPYV